MTAPASAWRWWPTPRSPAPGWRGKLGPADGDRGKPKMWSATWQRTHQQRILAWLITPASNALHRAGQTHAECFIESFNAGCGRIVERDAVTSLLQARVALVVGRPLQRRATHSQLGWRTPAEFASASMRGRIWRCAMPRLRASPVAPRPTGQFNATSELRTDKSWGQRHPRLTAPSRNSRSRQWGLQPRIDG